MKTKDKKELQEKFGQRVSFDKTEMLFYSHDTASLPGVVKQLLKTVPEAVVQPISAEDVVFITQFARERAIPLTPRGGATSGWGGAIPTKAGIVVDFSRMRRILKIDKEKGVARVQAGVIWKNLEYELNKHDLALRIYPSSALSATVAGWVAEGGGGIGSYEFGQIGDNIESVDFVTLEGEVKTAQGDDLELVTEAEGITGLITEVVVKTRKAEEDIPVVASFPDLRNLLQVVREVNQNSLPLWHLSFSNAAFVTKQEEAEVAAARIKPHWGVDEEPIGHDNIIPEERCRALFVYPVSREENIKPSLLRIIEANQGQLEDKEKTEKEWQDRFYPIRLKRLGPSLISSEAIISVPVLRIEKVIEEIERKFRDIALTVTLLSHEEASLLGHLLGDERSAAYTFEFPRSMEIIDVACQHGGCPYSTGLYFTSYARQNLGDKKVKRLLEYKEKNDPQGILNPGKILPENRNPKLLHLTLGLARIGKPFLAVGRALFSRKPKLAKKIPPQIAYEAYSCAQCGYCIDVCDQYYGRQWESETARGRWYFLRRYLEGKAEFNQTMLDSFLLCTTCQRCNQVSRHFGNMPYLDVIF